MSKLVRARIKPVEQLPEWAKCCPEVIASYPKEEFHIDLDEWCPRQGLLDSCHFCKSPSETRGGYKVADQYLWAEVELLDLDEGPMEAIP